MKHWNNFPMGPACREFLEISKENYEGEQQSRPDEDTAVQFQSELLVHIESHKPKNVLEFVDLLEEFTNMGLSIASVKLYESNDFPEASENFRAMLSVGSAYMMESDLESAESALKKAQALEPSEASSYVNLANLYYSQHRDKDSLIWAEAGLGAEPNHHRLWEVIASIFMAEDMAGAGDRVRQLAEDHNSFAGLSLAAHLIAPDDLLYKSQLLEKPFDSGIRDEEYLVEYTAALGLAQQFEKIPAVLWQLERVEGKKASWKLKSHVAQAFFAMDQEKEAKELIAGLEKSDIPSGILTDLKQTYEQQFTEDA